VAKQSEYIAELHRRGLSEMLSHYAVNRLRLPETVLAAAAAVARGMEPSVASMKHEVPASEIIYWSQILSKELKSEGLEGSSKMRGVVPASLKSADSNFAAELCLEDIELLENQLAYNAKNFLDREQASSKEISRLKEALALEKHNNIRIVAGK
jgi:hypothetical protein